jgi:hypothetical protein
MSDLSADASVNAGDIPTDDSVRIVVADRIAPQPTQVELSESSAQVTRPESEAVAAAVVTPAVASQSASDFKAEDLDNPHLLNKLLEDIANDPSIVDTLPEDELLRVQKLLSPYGTVPESVKADRWTCLSFVNLRQEYMKKMLITGFLAYLYRRCDEYGRQFKDTVENMDDMAAAEKQVIENQRLLRELDGKIITALRERNELEETVARDEKQEKKNNDLYDARKCEMTKEKILELRDFKSKLIENQDRLRLKNKEIARLEEEMDAIQGFGKRFIIRQFLDEQFRFNPDKHVRSSYVGSNTTANKTGRAYIEKFTPPDDTFHNFQYYLDSNYEEIRGVAERVYRMTPDLEVSILPYADFPNEREADDFVARSSMASGISSRRSSRIATRLRHTAGQSWRRS